MAIPVRTREPNGRLSRSADYAVDAGASPAAARRLRDAALRGMASPEWGTELGRLFLAGQLDAAQYIAGKKWVSAVARYHEAIGADAVGMAASNFERVDPSRDISDPETDEGRRRLKLARQAITEMRGAHHALKQAGRDAERAVREVCEADGAVRGWGGFRGLSDGLTSLVGFWGLRKR